MNNEKKKNAALGCFAGAWILIVTFVGLLLLSFGIVAGITWLIFWCFGWPWSWPIALGIWLLAILLRSLFSSNTNVTVK